MSDAHPTEPIDHRSHPPVTAMGPDLDGDEELEEAAIDAAQLEDAELVDEFLEPGAATRT